MMQYAGGHLPIPAKAPDISNISGNFTLFCCTRKAAAMSFAYAQRGMLLPERHVLLLLF